MKKILIFTMVIIIICLGVLGVNDYNDEKTFSEATDITKIYLEKNYKDIGNIIFTETKFSPIGTVVVDGYVNGDKKNLYFNTNVNPEQKKVNSIRILKKFPDLKSECQDSVCE